MGAGRPIGAYDYTPEELQKEAEEYFKDCDSKKVKNASDKEIPKPKTISGLRKWLRVGKNYINQKAKEPNFSGIIQQIYDEIEEDVQNNASLGFTNPTIAVRNLSANFDWKDKTEVESTNLNYNKDITEASDEELDKIING